MILGQAYFYNKLLNNYTFPLSLEEIKNVQLLGLRPFNPQDYLNLKTSEANRLLRDFFVEDYRNLLVDENLDFSLKFWLNLTSPTQNNQFNFQAISDFKNTLLDWKNSQYDLAKLENVLKEDLSAISETDFILYYGLRVLSKMSGKIDAEDSSNLTKIELPDSLDDNLTQDPEILVVTSKSLSPLFLSLNCEVMSFLEDPKLLLLEIKQRLETSQSLQLVIVDSLGHQQLKFLQTNLPEILVTGLNTETNAQSLGFFDELVKATLGVKLT